jgi:hypothetical protein
MIDGLDDVVDRLSSIYTPAEVQLWLNTNNALLEGERPIDLIREGRYVQVMVAIERLDAGAFL